ncbi:hypothetical protein JHK84_051007 [Glycine max]|uniref:Uncharacterized protein n=1 Tax=Glycine soja TaxID=3848 RepID=A0A0B2QFN1_GLYSO|nr:hypothetical protein JHK84_051007 [Glycine max]KHN20326.1 hypothetical protein glysoja_034709 [Glycine soja]
MYLTFLVLSQWQQTLTQEIFCSQTTQANDEYGRMVLAVVLYSFLATLGTKLHTYNNSNTNLLPIITCAMLMLGSVVSILALSFISSTFAWITLALWVGIFTLISHEYGAHKRTKIGLPVASHGAKVVASLEKVPLSNSDYTLCSHS